MKSIIPIPVIAIFCLFNYPLVAQERDTISDFYEYANREWLDNTTIPENSSVINDWGILWDDIIDKSIEILSGGSSYNLDKNYQYNLTQLRNFYKSATEYSTNERKRVYLVQKHYPMLFGVVFSKITIPQNKEKKIKEINLFVKTISRQKLIMKIHKKISPSIFVIPRAHQITCFYAKRFLLAKAYHD